MKAAFAWGGFGFGLCVAGGMVDDGLVTAIRVWALGLAIMVASIVTMIVLVIKHLDDIRGKSPD